MTASIRCATSARETRRPPRTLRPSAVSRLCVDHIRSARVRRERLGDAAQLETAAPVGRPAPVDPADRITLDDEVRIALSVVLQRLGPAERVAFVLHDVFRLPFESIAETLGRPPAACRQFARRARLKVVAARPGSAPVDAAEHRAVTERFMAACANGDLDALVGVLAPDVWGAAEFVGSGSPPQTASGSDAVAGNLLRYWGTGVTLVSLPVGPEPTLLAFADRHPIGVITLTVRDGLVAKVHVTADPATLQRP